MSSLTTPDSIPFWTTSPSDPASIVTESAVQATGIQAAFDKRQNYDYRWANAAARNAQTGMNFGSQGFQVDTGEGYFFNGAVWGLWDKPVTAFTPTLTNINLGTTGTNFASWSAASGRAFVQGVLTLGGTGFSFSGSPRVTFPAPSVSTVANTIIGQSGFRDEGSTTYTCVVNQLTTTTAEFLVLSVGSTYAFNVGPSNTVPFTWVAGDYITYTYSYVLA